MTDSIRMTSSMLKAYLKEYSITLNDLSEYTGIVASTLSQLKNGLRAFTPKYVETLMKYAPNMESFYNNYLNTHINSNESHSKVNKKDANTENNCTLAWVNADDTVYTPLNKVDDVLLRKDISVIDDSKTDTTINNKVAPETSTSSILQKVYNNLETFVSEKTSLSREERLLIEYLDTKYNGDAIQKFTREQLVTIAKEFIFLSQLH